MADTYYQCTALFYSREAMEAFFVALLVEDEAYERVLRCCDFDLWQNIMRLDVRLTGSAFELVGDFRERCVEYCSPDGLIKSLRTPSGTYGTYEAGGLVMMGKVSYYEACGK